MFKSFSKIIYLQLLLLASILLIGCEQRMYTADIYDICDSSLHLHSLAGASTAYPGEDRQYRVYVPLQSDRDIMPVVYAFHGRTDDPTLFIGEAEIYLRAEQADVIIVMPVAQPHAEDIQNNVIDLTVFPPGDLRWYAGDIITSSPGDVGHHDDKDFIADLIDVIDAQPCTSTERYAFGHSSGNGMSMALACLLPDKFESVGGASASFNDSSCAAALPHVPAIGIHATHDDIVDYTASKAMFDGYATRNACAFTPPTTPDIEWTPSQQHNYVCPVGAEVIFHQLDHALPTLGVSGHAWLTTGNSGKNATQTIFEFFGLL